MMVSLDGTAHAGQPVDTETLEVQLLQLLEELASGNFGAAIGTAVEGYCPGVKLAHQSTNGDEPRAGNVTPTVTVARMILWGILRPKPHLRYRTGSETAHWI